MMGGRSLLSPRGHGGAVLQAAWGYRNSIQMRRNHHRSREQHQPPKLAAEATAAMVAMPMLMLVMAMEVAMVLTVVLTAVLTVL